MNNKLENELVSTLQLIIYSYNKHGAKKTNKIISSAIISDELSLNNNIEKIDFIINSVLDIYKNRGVKREYIFDNKKRGETTIARKFIVLLIKHNIQISDRALASYFGGRCRQVVYRIVREFEDLDAQNKLDKEFIEQYNQINLKIREQLIKLNDN